MTEHLPKIREAFDAGHLKWTKAREITKAATPDTEAEWLAKSERLSVDELRAERKGEEPKRRRGHMLTLEEAATYDQLLAGFSRRRRYGTIKDLCFFAASQLPCPQDMIFIIVLSNTNGC